MKKAVFAVLILALFWSCESLTVPQESKKANVVMVTGPTFEDGTANFKYKGTVQNQGDATAGFTRVIIYIRDSSGSSLKQGETNIADVSLEPNQTADWEVAFADADSSLRGSMDKSKTTYEIKWE